MTETVVHVTTIEQWKNVLDVWFEQGYQWPVCNDYREIFFTVFGSRQLQLSVDEDNGISYWSNNDYSGDNLIEYAEFMAQQKDDKEMATYYVTQEQLDLIEELKVSESPVYRFYVSDRYQTLSAANELDSVAEKALLRYIGGDETIEFKVKEPLYRLRRNEDSLNTVYMNFNGYGTPGWVFSKELCFTATLEEIKKYQTPAWEIEKVE